MKTRRRPPGGSAWCLYARLVTQPTFWRKVKQLVNSLSQIFYFYPFYLVSCSDISWHLLVCNISGKWCQPNGLLLFPIIWYIGISHEIFLEENPHGDECCIGLRTIFGAAEAMLLCWHLRIDTSRANAEDETTGNQLALDLQTVEGIQLCKIFQW